MDFITDWIRDSTVRGRVEDVHKPGEYNANWTSRLAGGLFGVDVEGVVDKHTQTVNNKEVDDILESAGETREGLGLSPNASSGKATAAITEKARERVQEDKTTEFNRGLQATMAPISAQLAQSSQEFNATMRQSMAQQAQTHQLALMDRADNREAKAAELEYQRMRDRKTDQQYNERMEQLDRKDRRSAMSSLAGGLAALGAAFAL